MLIVLQTLLAARVARGQHCRMMAGRHRGWLWGHAISRHPSTRTASCALRMPDRSRASCSHRWHTKAANISLRGIAEQQRVRCRALEQRDPSTIYPNAIMHAPHVAHTSSASVDARFSYPPRAVRDLHRGRSLGRQGRARLSPMEPRPESSRWAAWAGLPQPFTAVPEPS